MSEIWKRTKNVVPLQSIREMLCECGLRLSIARASSALHSPCTSLVIVNHERHKWDSATRCSWPQVNLILCKNTFLSTMAKIIYEVKKNQNSHSAAFGKWYAQIKNLETLNTRKLAVLLHPGEPEERSTEEGGLQREQAPEGAPHPIPARAGSRGEHFL